MRQIIIAARGVTRWADAIQPLLLLVARVYVASVFLRSGFIKLSDWSSTLALFRDEYHVPLLSPDFAAVVGTFGETTFPILVLFGLAGRLGALGMFVVNAMAVVSYPQLWGFDCPAGIHQHFFWGATLLALVAFGPGKWSLDTLILRKIDFEEREIA